MRMMLRVTVPTEDGNRGVKDGSLPKAIQETMRKLKTEAAYFAADQGCRSAMFFFDMQEASEIPPIVEPWFLGFNAEVELLPVMNADDLKLGIDTAARTK
jgi:hypothetical protein